MPNKDYQNLIIRLKEMAYFRHVIALLDWDAQVYMPEKGSNIRSQALSFLSALAHQKLLEINRDGLLNRLKKAADNNKLNYKEVVVVREVLRTYTREIKLPEAFVKELSELLSKAHLVWVDARAKKDFKLFLPTLKKIVELKRTEAKLVGYKNSPYNALLDYYEPSTTTEDLDIIFSELKKFLIPFIKKIKESKIKTSTSILNGKFPITNQQRLSNLILEKMGFDLSAGRLDISAHPFTTEFASTDVRLTTHYKEKNLWSAISSTIHEMGHGLYEQGLPEEHYGTPLGESVSLGVHESQSRTWENLIGRSFEFSKFITPFINKEFSKNFSKLKPEKLYTAINKVQPSFVRVEADEVTYNLHIILRYEIEKNLIEGTIEVEDLPKIWNQKMQEYFGIRVPNDSLGVLQDVHWSAGLFGYFPTYTLGNLYSAQFFMTAQKALPNLQKEIAKGDFAPFLKWLRKNIHAHGKLHSAKKLMQNVTGEIPESKYYIDYIKNKYRSIYKI